MARLSRGIAACVTGLVLAAAAASCDRSSSALTAPSDTPAVRSQQVAGEEPAVSEERIEQIWTSFEVARVRALHTEFVVRVDSALRSGVPLEELRSASREAFASDDSRLAALLFASREEADRYVASLQAARQAVLDTYPEVGEARTRMGPSACAINENAVDAYFDHFATIRDYQLSADGERNAFLDCDKLKQTACLVGCIGGSGPLTVSFCNTVCMCKFCDVPFGPIMIMCETMNLFRER